MKEGASGSGWRTLLAPSTNHRGAITMEISSTRPGVCISFLLLYIALQMAARLLSSQIRAYRLRLESRSAVPIGQGSDSESAPSLSPSPSPLYQLLFPSITPSCLRTLPLLPRPAARLVHTSQRSVVLDGHYRLSHSERDDWNGSRKNPSRSCGPWHGRHR